MSKLASSFRDPAGFMYTKNGILYRQVNVVGASDYDGFMHQLYHELVKRDLIVAHEEVSLDFAHSDDAYKVLRPERLPFISYPYEWTFEQLKDAALLTLRIQKIAMKLGFILKDASAYNIQFVGSQPIFIDTLSFMKYEEGQPWEAYQQFCRHFLAPLALASYHDVDLVQLMRLNIDGVPLSIASKLLPWITRLRPSMQIHLHLHARLQNRAQRDENVGDTVAKRGVDRKTIEQLVSDLNSLVSSLEWSSGGTPWEDYYEGDSYVDAAFEQKKEIVKSYIEQADPNLVWDLGANAGEFSALTDVPTVSWDYDSGAVEHHYKSLKAKSNKQIIPLIQDLMNPSPDLGWMSAERDGFLSRAEDVDLAMALALIHHIVIANNVPLGNFAQFMRQIAPKVIIEFVPKSDPKVGLLLKNRRDIFPDYHREGFEQAIAPYFEIVHARNIPDSGRTLYYLEAKA